MFPSYDTMKIISECPVCRKKDFPADVQLVAEQSEAQLLHIRCKSCGGCMMVVVSLLRDGMSLMGILTDLNSTEAVELVGESAITADDLISLHESLAGKTFIDQLFNL